MRNFKKYLLTLCSACTVVIGAMALVSCRCKPSVEPHVHDYGATTTKEATCTEEGIKKYTCDCGDFYTQTIEMLPHSWGEFSVLVEPTCLEGEEERACKACGLVETRKIKSLGDEGHDWREIRRVPPCEQDGLIVYKCGYCQRELEEVIPMQGHVWVNDSCTACGQNASKNLQYRLNADGDSYTLVGVGNCRDEKIYVPSIHNDKPVKSVDGAFNGYDWLVRLEIIGNVETIDSWAGANCSKLEWIVLADSVRVIEDHAFAESNALEIIDWGNSIEVIGESAFYSCDSLSQVILPSSVTYIQSYAFYNCDKLLDVQIPGSVVQIDKFAFADSVKLKELLLGEGVQYIGESVFVNCDSLQTVVIPNSVTEIGKNAFMGCDSLESLTIGDGVAVIHERAFSNNRALKVVEMPSALTSVGEDAFSNNYNLEKVIIDDLSAWCNISFANKTANPLANGRFGNSSTILYVGNNEKTWVSIPEVTAIAPYAFYGYNKMKKLTIPKTVTSIGDEAFAECTNLSSIEFNAAACEVGKNIFNNSCSYASVVFGCDVQYIPFSLFKAEEKQNTANIVSIAFNENSICTEILGYAFAGCETLNTVQISDSVTSIGYQAFADCNSIYTLTANTYAFEHLNVNSVRDLTVVSGDIKAGSFEGLQSLRTLQLLVGVTSIGEKAFASCGNLTKVEMASPFDYPDSFIEIHRAAFAFDVSLSWIYLPQANIGELAFYSCTSLTSVLLGGGAKNVTVGDYAFADCANLDELDITEDVVRIGANAFKGTILQHVDFLDRMYWYVEGETEPLWTTYLAEPDVAAQFLVKDYCDRVWTFVPAKN